MGLAAAAAAAMVLQQRGRSWAVMQPTRKKAVWREWLSRRAGKR
jgi:hypothetical protein